MVKKKSFIPGFHQAHKNVNFHLFDASVEKCLYKAEHFFIAVAIRSISDISDLERAVHENKVPRVDVFSLVHIIGKGDYCVAFRAHAGNPVRAHYAVLFPNEPRYSAHVRKKARILNRLGQNAHTTRFIYHGDYRGMPFLAESYAYPLSRVIDVGNSSGLRPNIDCFKWFVNDLLVALDYFHAQGNTHGDLHPGNVALGEGMKVKLIDLDFASSSVVRSAGLTSGRSVSNGYGVVSGGGALDYLYAAPEVCDGAVATPSSDIYSAGAVCFALLTGRPPQRGEYDVHALRPDLPRWTNSLLASMIQRNTHRPSAFQMQQWLREYVHHDEIMGMTH